MKDYYDEDERQAVTTRLREWLGNGKRPFRDGLAPPIVLSADEVWDIVLIIEQLESEIERD